jgi:glutamate-1-semialdehyde 2,1-aminomutase/spore coat polysaccharide biosynthesis protein SpsF
MENRTIIITQARTGSTRFPRKILEKINQKTLLEIHLQRLKKSRLANEIILATTTKSEDNIIDEIGQKLGIQVFRGSEENVLSRFWHSVAKKQVDYLVRVTSDCPLIDPRLIDLMLTDAHDSRVDYLSNTLKETFPDGQDIEIFTKKALKKAHSSAILNSHKEHVTLFIKENSDYMGKHMFRAKSYERATDPISDIRMTVDEREDLDVMKLLIEPLGFWKGYLEYSEFYLLNELSKINGKIYRNEGLKKSLQNEDRARII